MSLLARYCSSATRCAAEQNASRDIAWERVHSYISHQILSAVLFIVPFQVCSVRCSFQLLLRSLFHFKYVAFVVPFQVRCLCCSISTPCVMSFKFLPYCCDPLKSHTRKRTRGSLRPMPNSLITKFPSIQTQNLFHLPSKTV